MRGKDGVCNMFCLMDPFFMNNRMKESCVICRFSSYHV